MAGIDLTGRIALVTGATGGLGRALAAGLAAAGADLVLNARSASELALVAREIASTSPRAPLALAADVTALAEVAALRDEVERRLGTPAILVNGAGSYGPLAPVSQSDPESWLDALMVNAFGPYLMCHEFVPGMLRLGWGRIVNISSAAPLRPPGALGSAYATSKAALNRMTRHLAAELEGSGVAAIAVHPGSVMTAMTAHIRAEVERLGPEGAPFRSWLEDMDSSGGDSPANAVGLVLRLVDPRSDAPNGAFCWTPGTIEEPLPAW